MTSTITFKRRSNGGQPSTTQRVLLFLLFFLAHDATASGHLETSDPSGGGQTTLALNPVQTFLATIADAKNHLAAAAAVCLCTSVLCDHRMQEEEIAFQWHYTHWCVSLIYSAVIVLK